MNEGEFFMKILLVTGAATVGHIIYPNGMHGTGKIDEDALYPYTAETSRLCRGIAERFQYNKVETVISLAVGGNAILSQWVAYHLGEICRREVFSIYAEKETTPSGFGMFSPKHEDKLTIKLNHRGFIASKNVLIVGDFLTTGDYAKKLVETAQTMGGKVIGIGVLCNCAEITSNDIAVPRLVALTSLKMGTWSKGYCPFCKRNKKELEKSRRAPSQG